MTPMQPRENDDDGVHTADRGEATVDALMRLVTAASPPHAAAANGAAAAVARSASAGPLATRSARRPLPARGASAASTLHWPYTLLQSPAAAPPIRAATARPPVRAPVWLREIAINLRRELQRREGGADAVGAGPATADGGDDGDGDASYQSRSWPRPRDRSFSFLPRPWPWSSS